MQEDGCLVHVVCLATTTLLKHEESARRNPPFCPRRRVPK